MERNDYSAIPVEATAEMEKGMVQGRVQSSLSSWQDGEQQVIGYSRGNLLHRDTAESYISLQISNQQEAKNGFKQKKERIQAFIADFTS